MKPPLVSVIIPNYNHGRFLGRALQSVVDQTYKSWEAIVIDNHSTDCTNEVLSCFDDPRIKSIKIHNNGVIAASRNAGIREAQGQWLAFLDSDDWWTPTKLYTSCRALECGADVVYHDLYVVRETHPHLSRERVKASEPNYPVLSSLMCNGMSIPNSSVVVRRELVQRIGGINEDRELISVEDFDTWLTLAKITERFIRTTECDGYYWVGEGNMSAASPKQLKRQRTVYSNHMDDLPPSDQRRAKDFLTYRLARIAQMYGDYETALIYFLNALESSISLRYKCLTIYFMVRAVWARVWVK